MTETLITNIASKIGEPISDNARAIFENYFFDENDDMISETLSFSDGYGASYKDKPRHGIMFKKLLSDALESSIAFKQSKEFDESDQKKAIQFTLTAAKNIDAPENINVDDIMIEDDIYYYILSNAYRMGAARVAVNINRIFDLIERPYKDKLRDALSFLSDDVRCVKLSDFDGYQVLKIEEFVSNVKE